MPSGAAKSAIEMKFAWPVAGRPEPGVGGSVVYVVAQAVAFPLYEPVQVPRKRPAAASMVQRLVGLDHAKPRRSVVAAGA